MPVRFIHAADLHLDSPLSGLSGPDGDGDEAAAFIRAASRHALAALVDRAIAEDVAFVLLAGDLWDGSCVDVGTGLFFAAQMRRLRQAGIAVFAILGNHDAESDITRTPGLLEDLVLFPGDRALTHRLDAAGVAVHGRSFPAAAVEENLALGYPDPVPGVLNVALLHTALEGRPGHGRYAPCTIGDLVAKGFDYWALGHVHGREILADGRDGPAIAWSGVLQGRHVREEGPKGAFLVETDGRAARLTPIDLDVVRWTRIEVDLTGAETMAEAARMVAAPVRNRLEALPAGPERRLTAARLAVTGATALHGHLDFTRDRLREAALYAAGDENLFLEKVEMRTAAPARTTGDGPDEPAARDTVAALLDVARRDPALGRAFADHVLAVLRSAPADVRRLVEESEPDLADAGSPDALDRFLGEAAGLVRAGLAAPSSGDGGSA